MMKNRKKRGIDRNYSDRQIYHHQPYTLIRQVARLLQRRQTKRTEFPLSFLTHHTDIPEKLEKIL